MSKCGCSHLASSLSCAEILIAAFKETPHVLLSKGHAGAALYAVMIENGLLKESEVNFLPSHPAPPQQPFTTGSLGFGPAFGAGLALSKPDEQIYVIMSDGELDEGATWETFKIIVDKHIANVKIIVDCNGWQAYKRAASTGEIYRKLTAFDFRVIKKYQSDSNLSFQTDGTPVPTAFIVETTKGRGLPSEDTMESHYAKP